jgi:hypothetical protein
MLQAAARRMELLIVFEENQKCDKKSKHLACTKGELFLGAQNYFEVSFGPKFYSEGAPEQSLLTGSVSRS